MSVVIIDAKQTACKRGCFSEGYQDGLVDLPGGIYLDADVEENQSTENYKGGYE